MAGGLKDGYMFTVDANGRSRLVRTLTTNIQNSTFTSIPTDSYTTTKNITIDFNVVVLFWFRGDCMF